MSYSFDESIVSDLYKDTYGFRPKESFWNMWSSVDDGGKQLMWDALLEVLDKVITEEDSREKQAIVDFEKLIARAISYGAKTREVALQWIMESSDCNGDWDHLCWKYGIPYTYFANSK